MIKFYKSWLMAAAGILTTGAAMAQAPTDNPYRTWKQNMPPTHWTDSLKWGQVFNIKDYSQFIQWDVLDVTTGKRRANWLPAYEAARDAAAAAGGGVVFFPRLPQMTDFPDQLRAGEDSSYYFKDHIILKNGVVLRGETPHPDSASALTRTFKPPVLLEFPQYDYLAGVGGTGTPNSTAFKNIRMDPSAAVQNSGLVFLDINRAGVVLMPRFASQTVPDPVTGGTRQTQIATDNNRNILLMGLRINNYIEPTPEVPNSAQDAWQRYPWRFGSPFNVFVKSNTIIANNRINDADSTLVTNRNVVSESFVQTNYKTTSPGQPTLASVTFDYTQAYGILVNRLKRSFPQSISGFGDYSTPESEPDLFAPGIVVENNWIYHTARVGIQAGGSGTIVRNNVVRDNRNKQTYLRPTGVGIESNAVVTHENRGVDVSGQGILVENNSLQVYRFKLPTIGSAAYSADGEGFYTQMVGGAQSSNLTFRNNTVITSRDGMAGALTSGQRKGFNGVNNAKVIEGVVIEGNNSGGMPIWVQAQNSPTNPAGSDLTVSNVFIRDNIEVRGIRLEATAGGGFNYIHNNSPATDSVQTPLEMANRILTTCHVWLNDDPNQPRNLNTNRMPALPCNPVNNPNPCASPYPTIAWTSPVRDTAFAPGSVPATFDLMVDVLSPGGSGSCQADFVQFYIDNNPVAMLTTPTGGAGQFSHTINLPASGNFEFTAYAVSQVSQGTANAIKITSPVRRFSLVTGNKPQLTAATVNLYPNPATGKVYLETRETVNMSVSIIDLLGKELRSVNLEAASRHEMDLQGLAPGLYFVSVTDGTSRVVKRLRVN